MTTPGFNTRLNPVEVHDEGCVLVPWGFRINGTSNPDELQGDMLESVVRDEAGEFTCTLKAKPAKCFYGDGAVSQTADDSSVKCDVDWSTVVSDGTFKVRTFGPTDTVLTSGALTGSVTDGHSTVVGADATLDSTAITGTVSSLAGTMSGVEADPADDLLVGGFLLVKKTTRTRTG